MDDDAGNLDPQGQIGKASPSTLMVRTVMPCPPVITVLPHTPRIDRGSLKSRTWISAGQPRLTPCIVPLPGHHGTGQGSPSRSCRETMINFISSNQAKTLKHNNDAIALDAGTYS